MEHVHNRITWEIWMHRQARIRSAELDYQARKGDLIDRLVKAGHHPKVTVVLLGEVAVNYRVLLSCTRCEETKRRWPRSIWSGLSPNRPCPAGVAPAENRP